SRQAGSRTERIARMVWSGGLVGKRIMPARIVTRGWLLLLLRSAGERAKPGRARVRGDLTPPSLLTSEGRSRSRSRRFLLLPPPGGGRPGRDAPGLLQL